MIKTLAYKKLKLHERIDKYFTLNTNNTDTSNGYLFYILYKVHVVEILESF